MALTVRFAKFIGPRKAAPQLIYQVQNEAGKIDFSRGVIGKIVMRAALAQSGRLWVANHKGRLVRWKPERPIFDSRDFIEVQISEKGVDIRINVVIRFGTSIAETTERLINQIHADLLRLAGISANSIAVIVTGVASKSVSRRYIEIKQ